MPLVGIDLGTTNSVVAVWRDGAAEIVPGVGGLRLTPSVVSADDNGSLLVGAAAWERLVSHPTQTVATFKRRMGSDDPLRLGRTRLSPSELSALVLRKLLEDVTSHIGESVAEAVISVPAYFSDAQRRATKAAGEMAGVKVTRLINEPTAAAIAYGLNERVTDRTVLVIDLGGGTLDVSILEFFDGVMQVHATAGDVFLGGTDFDRVIVDGFISTHALSRFEALPAADQGLLMRASIRAKHALSTSHSAELSLRLRERSSRQLDWSLSREAFEQLAESLLARVRRVVERAIRDAKMSATSVDDVVLVGGATRMPMIRQLAGRLFGKLPLSHINPDEVVALGAATQAALIARDATLEDFVLTDVAPYTLGIDIARELSGQRFEEGLFMPIIERNTRIPVSRVSQVAPIHKNQQVVTCSIYQGESRLVKNNLKIGEIEVPLPRRGQDSISVRFTYDVNGILEVLLEVFDSDVARRLVINQSGASLAQTEIEASLAKLAALKIHPRDREENRVLLARAERMYEEALADVRDQIAALIAVFEDALGRQDPDEIAELREQTAAQLKQFDRDIF